MESLLASYASSDEEEEHNQEPVTKPPSVSRPNSSSSSSSSVASLFSSLPQPKPGPKPAFSSIPNPQNPRPPKPVALGSGDDDSELPNPRLKLFSSLPQPKQSQNPSQQPKRVVQIRPQINLPRPIVDDDEDEDEGEKEKKRKRDLESAAQNSSVQSFLSSLPAARGSTALGALPSSGAGRRMVIDTDSNAPSSSGSLGGDSQSGFPQNGEDYSNYVNHHDSVAAPSDVHSSGDFMGNNDVPVGVDQKNGGYYGSYTNPSGGNYVSYDNSYANYYQTGYDQSASGGEDPSYGGYGGYGNYGNVLVDSEIKVTGKRGRSEIPAEIVEVKQDELMKNRPREDQMKLTGIAFGPSYQPVPTKGKPTKLHKRKHQIGSLYYDMKQKEMELTERRSRGLLTKAQTQGKYGW